jgi:hypothetical protein
MEQRILKNRGVGGGILQGVIHNVRNNPTVTQEAKKILEITHMN